MSLTGTEKVNLEVYRSFSSSTATLKYFFRITSHDAVNNINMSDLRVVFWTSTNWNPSEITQSTQNPQPFGGASGNPSVTSTKQGFHIGTGLPPRIGVTSDNSKEGRWNLRSTLTFSSNILTGSGQGFRDIQIEVKNSSSKNYDLVDGALDYTRSFSYLTATGSSTADYVDSDRFLLQYFNGSIWQRMPEHIDANTPDPSQGEWPYGDAGEDDTTIDHWMTEITEDTFISESDPNSTFSSVSSLSLEASVGSTKKRAWSFIDVAGFPTSVAKAESWHFMDQVQDGNADSFSFITTGGSAQPDDTMTWLNSSTGVPWGSNGGDLGTVISTFDALRTGGGITSFQNAFIRIALTSFVQLWKTGTIPNYGYFQTITNDASKNASSILASSVEANTARNRPFVVVSGINDGVSARRSLGTT